MRESAGLSGWQVAEALGWSQSKVSRVEGGRLGISLNDLAAVLALYEVPEEVRAELLSAAVASDGLPGAWIVRAGGPPRRQGEVAAVEARVRRIRQYAALTMPGLLQCAEYTRAMAVSGGFGDPEALVSRRRARQELLMSESAPRYEVVLDERCVQRWPGGQDVMTKQLAHLVAATESERVSLWLLPVGGGARSTGLAQFLMYDFLDPTSPAVVMLESQTADTYLSSAGDVEAYATLFGALRRESMTEAESLQRLRELRQQVRTTRVEEGS